MKKGLLEEILANNQGRAGTVCAVKKVLDNMSADDAKDLRGAIDDPLIKATAIYKALKTRGYQISDGTISRHRRKECVCES